MKGLKLKQIKDFINGKNQKQLKIRAEIKKWWTESEETKQLSFLSSPSVAANRFQITFIWSKPSSRGMNGVMVYHNKQ